MNILFFAPNQGIWPFTYPESLIANSLKLLGHNVIYLNCNKLYSNFCLTQNALGLKFNSAKEEKEKACKECLYKRELVVKNFSFENYFINDFISKEEQNRVLENISQMSFEQCLEYVINGIAVGKKALYEFLLNHKKSSLDMSEDELREYMNCFKNCLITHTAITNFFQKHKIDKVIMFNTLYSVNSVVRDVAESLKKGVYTLHAGLNLSDRYQKILFGKHATVAFLRHVKEQWPKFKNIPVTQTEANYVASHFLELFKGQNSYAFSSEKSKSYFDVREKFAIPKDKKIIVAMMSSYDEQFANLKVNNATFNMIFPTQIDWINELVTYFKNNPDLFLIIRVHPREFPRNANSVLSEHAQKLQREFAALPDNVRINWPLDNVSMYDLMEETDLFLSAWSSTGKEMSFFGRPVLIYTEDYIFYPADLNIYINNKHDYLNAIRENLNNSFDFERIQKSFRWFALDQYKAIIDIGDLSTIQENRDKIFIRRAFKKILRTLNERLLFKFDLLNKNKKLKNSQVFEEILKSSLHNCLDLYRLDSSETVENETRYIKDSLRKVYQAMYGEFVQDPTYPANSLRNQLFNLISN